MNSGSYGVRFVGICGIGGIGKTTLAKAVFNQFFHTFEGKTFIANVRENSGNQNDLLKLQEKLLCDTLKLEKIKLNNTHRGINVIKERLSSRKVLIILDDIDHLDQLRTLAGGSEWFGSGSVIIFTTRYLDLLKEVDADLYMARGLDEEESLQLFSLHAFGTHRPKEEYVRLSAAIIRYSKGLPLALEVLGSFLHGRSMEQWEQTLEKLKRIPDNNIQAQLRISYDSLGDDTEKALFLDIACFFVDWDKDYVVKILNACGLFAEIGISVLRQRCLLQSDTDKKLMMHDLVRDMGREIVRKESPCYPGRRSRLWFPLDICSTLRDQKGTEEIEGISLDSSALGEQTVSAEAFARMGRLRLLQLNGVNVHGNYGLISKELRWLRWHKFSLNFVPNNFYMENLVTLEMPHSNLREVWKDNKLLGNLKVLNLSHSHFLTKTPNFFQLPNLEELILNDCIELVDIHQSIGILERLLLVNLEGCKKLKKLPVSICRVSSLKILKISGCTKMDNLPEDIGEITSLERFAADGTAITQVPSSIKRLKNLTDLSLCGCKASNSSSIYSLIWSLVRKRKVPRSNDMLMSSLVGLSSLQSLRLRDCNLLDDTIPLGIGSLPLLEELDLSQNNFSYLPDSLSLLPKLHTLKLNDCAMLQTIPKISAPYLSTLFADRCQRLEKIMSVSNILSLSLDDCPRLTEICDLENESASVMSLIGCKSLATDVTHFLLQSQVTASRELFLPGSEIPDSFSYQRAGPSLSFRLSRSQLGKLNNILNTFVVYEANKAVNTERPLITVYFNVRTRNSKIAAFPLDTYIPAASGHHIWASSRTLEISKRVGGSEEIEFELTTETAGEVRVKRLGVHLGNHIGLDNSLWSLGNMDVGTSTQLPRGGENTDFTEEVCRQTEWPIAEDSRGYDASEENRPPKRMRFEPIEEPNRDEM